MIGSPTQEEVNIAVRIVKLNDLLCPTELCDPITFYRNTSKNVSHI